MKKNQKTKQGVQDLNSLPSRKKVKVEMPPAAAFEGPQSEEHYSDYVCDKMAGELN